MQIRIPGENINTNNDFVNFCCENPVSEAIWNAFIAESNYDEAYMQDGYEILKQEGFIYCC